MARYTVKDNATKKTVTFEWDGDAPPTDSDMAEVFSAARVTRSAEIGKGAKMSPQEASTYAADRAAFAQQGGVSTFGTKQGGDTRKISYTDTGYRPNQPAKSLKDVARNAVQDVVELPLMPVRMLSDIANSPDTPRTLKDIGVNMARGPLEFVPGVGEALGGRSATEAWATNPGFGAMTLAGIGAAGKAMKGKGGAPVAEVSKGGGLAEKTAAKLYDMTLKQGTTMKPEIRRQNVREGLQGGYLPNNKGVDKLAADISAAERNVGEGIKAGAEAGVRGNFDRAIANIESLREQAMRSDNPAKNLALIDAEIEQLRAHPILEGVTPPPTFREFTKGKMGPYMKEEGGHGAAMQRLSKEYKETKAEAAKQTGTVPIDQLQRMKVEQGRHVKYQEKNGQAVDPFKASIDKARIRGFKEELETQLADVFPELKDQNAQLSRKYKLQDVLERAANRIENSQGIGIGLPIKGSAGATIGGMVGGPAGAAIGTGIGTLIGIIEHPAVAPRLAVALYRASKGKMTMVQARTAADDRLKFLKDKLKDERGMVGKDIDGGIPPTLRRLTNDGKLTIYHGSEQPINTFDLSRVGKKRGTTEGWGAYYATDQRNSGKFGKNTNSIDLGPEQMERFLDEKAKYSEQTPYVQKVLKPLMEDIEKQSLSDIAARANGWIKNHTRMGKFPSPGVDPKIYESVKSLRWKPEELKKYLATIDDAHLRKMYSEQILGKPDPTGKEIYKLVENEFGGYEKKASEILRDYGISGKVVSSNRDLHSVVDSPNLVIWDQDLLNTGKHRKK